MLFVAQSIPILGAYQLVYSEYIQVVCNIMNKTIYKYLPPERITYLKDEHLRFTPPGDLNDPFECYPVMPTKEDIIKIINIVASENIVSLVKEKLSKSELKRVKNEYDRKVKSKITAVRKDHPNNFQEQFYKRSIVGLNQKIGILSLSRRWDSALMWAHYTNSHKGFCIGFNKDSEYFQIKGNPNDPISMLQPVEYSENRIKVPLERNIKINPKVMLTKAVDWKYEEERFVSLLPFANKIIKSSRFDIHLFKVPHKIITEIIVGAKIDNEDFNAISNFCKENDIPMFRCLMSPTKFDMIRNP
jgi:hypothetical protein